MRYLFISLLILSVSLLTGCGQILELKDDVSEKIFGSDREEDNPTPLQDLKQAGDAKLLWSATVGESEIYEFSPAIDGKYIYAASETGELTKLDAATGKQEWRVSAGESLSGGVGAGEGLVLTGTKGAVLAFDQATGKPLWKSRLAGEVLSAPRVDGGVVVVRSGDSRIYGINVADGKRKWVYERTTPTLSLRSSAGVTIADGAALVGFSGGKLVALRVADGKIIWEATVAQPKGATEIERIADITSLPVVDGRFVYAAAFQGRVVGIERSTGKVLWNRDISSYYGLTVDGSVLYLTQSNGATYALDYSTGKTYWRQGGLQYRKTTAPVSLGRTALFGDFEGWVHLLSRDDGDFVGRVKTDGSAVMPQPVVLNDTTALFQTRAGGLYAVSIK
ncbi:MAG: outer membrane protein assembly factor BamB [Methylophilales bacterium]|nr:outer membrane protein assembly factor BamB [Methylophilales bacterium]